MISMSTLGFHTLLKAPDPGRRFPEQPLFPMPTKDRHTLNLTWWGTLISAIVGILTLLGGIFTVIWTVSNRVRDIEALRETVARAEASAARAETAAAQAQRATSEMGGDVKAIRQSLDDFRAERDKERK